MLSRIPGLSSLDASKPSLWQIKISLNISKDLLGRQNCPPHEKHSPSGSYTVRARCVHGVLREDRNHLSSQIAYIHLEVQWGD